MATFCMWLWGIVLVFGFLFWRRYPPGHEFRRASLIIVVLASCTLPALAIADWQDAQDRSAYAAAAAQFDALRQAWRENHPDAPGR